MSKVGKVNQRFPLPVLALLTLFVLLSAVPPESVVAQVDETMVPFPKRFAPVRSLVKKKPKNRDAGGEQEMGRKTGMGAGLAGDVGDPRSGSSGRLQKNEVSFPRPSAAPGTASRRARPRAPKLAKPAFAAYPVDSVPEYLVGHEDVLEISVWKNSELSKTVTVRPDGMISLPLIGDVLAAGRTPDELRQVITQRLQEYQENVVVSVMVNQVNSYRIYVLGEVVKPGVLALKRKTTLLQAIALAGGFNQFASKNKIMIIRERRSPTGREEKLVVRFDDIINTEDSKSNLFLRTGDTIFVP